MFWLNEANIRKVEPFLDGGHREFDSPYPHQERSRISEVVFVLVAREMVVMRYRR
jgi:hypothetical protein